MGRIPFQLQLCDTLSSWEVGSEAGHSHSMTWCLSKEVRPTRDQRTKQQGCDIPKLLQATVILNEEALISRIRHAPHDTYFSKKSQYTSQGHNKVMSLLPNGLLLLRDGKIYVPDYDSLQFEILHSNHDHKLWGHPGIRKTTQLINRLFFWPGLQHNVMAYVCGCHTCARAKPVQHKPYRLLKPLPIGEWPWTSISMDHIKALPLSATFDSILVVVCQLTKQVIFIPTNTTNTAWELAQHFISHVFSKHSLPADIVSDRGRLFVSKFWSSLCQALDITSNLSTTYHPETDGQMEWINQILEQYLRSHTDYLQDDWTSQLPFTMFIYNNTPHSTTGVSPFFTNKGYHPRLTISLEGIPAHKVHMVTTNLKTLHQHLWDQLKVVNEAYLCFTDIKCERAL